MSTQPTTAQKLRIAIIGGGIGGLSCAIALKDCKDIEVDLYEAAARITEIGAGITLWPRTWEVMKALGLEEDLRKLVKEKGDEVTVKERSGFEVRMSDRSDGFTFHNVMIPNDGANYYWHRQEIQQTLLKRVPSTFRIHLSHRLDKCEEFEDTVKLHFNNGATAFCDVAIGADGIKSVVRQAVLARSPLKNDGVFYTGSRAYRGLIPKEKLAEVHPGHRTLTNAIIYCGKGKHIIAFPISQDRYVNVVAFFTRLEDEGKVPEGPDVRECKKEEMLEEFAGWEGEVMDMLNCIEKPTCWNIRDLTPLEKYTTRRLALLGDAAHAMTPHLGAGAGQAIEDGYILGALFASTPNAASDVLRVLEVYNTIRRPYASRVRNNARSQGFYYELNAKEFKDVIKAKGEELNEGQIELLRRVLTDHWKWAWEEHITVDLERGVGLLKGQ